jgi:hypothetical protein
MWKIVVVLLLTALAILGARLAFDAARIVGIATGSEAPALITPPLMYAGIRG